MPTDPAPTSPSPEDMSRDLRADLRFLATFRDSVESDFWHRKISDRAREAWPAAIRRAIHAEAEAARLRSRVQELEEQRRQEAEDAWGDNLDRGL